MTLMKTRAQKVIIISLASLVFLAGLLTFLTPALLSTKWGNEKFIHLLNAQIPGNVSVNRFSVSWFGVQRIEGLSLSDPQGNSVLNFASLESETPLYTFLSLGPSAGKTTIRSLNAAIKKTESGLTNLQESLGIGRTKVKIPNELASLIDVDIEMRSPASLADLKVKATGKTQQGSISGKFDIDFNCNNQEDSCKVSVQSFPAGLLDSILAIEHPELSGLMTALAGDSLDLKVIENSKEESSAWTIQASSKNLTFSGEGRIDQGIFRLLSPAKLKATVTPQALKTLSPLASTLKEWQLASNAEVHMEIHDLRIPLQFFTSSISGEAQKELTIDASIALSGAELVRQRAPNERAEIKDISLKILSEEQSPSIRLSAAGSYDLADTPVKFQLATTVGKPKSLGGLIRSVSRPHEIQFALEQMPTAVIDELLGAGNIVSKAFGKELTLRMRSSANDFNTLQLSLSSKKIEIPSIVVTVDQNILQADSLPGSELSGILSIGKIDLLQSRNRVEIDSVSIPWSFSEGFSKIHLKFSGKTTALASPNGKFSGNLIAESPASPTHARIDMALSGESIPAPFLEWISGRNEIGPIFGPALNLDVAVKTSGMQGTVKALVKGSVGQVSVNASLSDHQIALSEPLILETQGSEELGKIALAKFAPVFRELISSDGQIRLTISPDNFSFPILPFSPERLQIGSAALDMGKLTFHNSGDVKSLLSVLKPARSDKISIWATPIYASVQNGVATVYRTDLLIMDKYPIASWGKIDLVKDDVQMVIGITGTALSQAMDIPGIEGGSMVQIPVTGTTGNAKIDSTKAAAKIGSLVAQQSGRPEGLIIGTVLSLAKGKEGNIPPPTTNPLPWAGREFGNPTSENDSGKQRSRAKKDPMKEIQKEASNMLKGLLR